MKSEAPNDYIFAPDQVPVWSQWKTAGAKVTRIVMGTRNSPMDIGPWPDLAAQFPNLKALHLFDLSDLQNISSLPPQLEILDIRNCPNLTTIPPLPEGLADLVLENLPGLTGLTTATPAIALHDVAIVRCSAIPQEQIHGLLGSIRNPLHGRTLGCLDLTGCGQLTELPGMLPDFARVLLGRCDALRVLPEYWPPSITRIDLANTAICNLPELFPDTLQYLDLRGCRELTSMPENWAQHDVLRTLFLSGSAVQSPPATLHGVGDENVAANVRHYFREMGAFGWGKYHRCKILLLGNGGVGKTTLSLSLEGKDQTTHPGSTHGIRMVECPVQVKHDGRYKTVERTIWDFGGQEIYHNTHAIFLKTNAVFVILWDGEMERDDGAGEEPWRPLRYWLDYIANYGPSEKRVVVVCNWRGTKEIKPDRKSKLEGDFESSISHLDWKPSLFITNAATRSQDYQKLVQWIDDNTVELAEHEGTRIVSYWEIAVDLVSAWIEQAEPKELSVADFQDDLQSLVNYCMRREGMLPKRVPEKLTTRFSAWRAGLSELYRSATKSGFVLDEEKTSQLLGFLHNAGLVYWKQDLFQKKIIISQRWALDGIYSLLSRDAPLRDKLKADRGRFTWEDLHDYWADRSLDEDQKKLLVSYMIEAGCCFTLIPEREKLNRDPVYVSLAHLPSMTELGSKAFFCDHDPDQKMEIQRLHLGHWHAMLRELGGIYGRDAEYATNGFAFRVEGAQTVVMRVRIDGSGIGGTVELYVLHPDPDKKSRIAASMQSMIARCLPAPDGGSPASPETHQSYPGNLKPGHGEMPDWQEGREMHRTHPAGPNPGKIQVFLSHAWPAKWDEQGNPIDPSIAAEYSSSVEYVEAEIKSLRKEVARVRAGKELELHYDKKTTIKDLMEFIGKIKECDLVIIVHSDKYWRSAWCMYEFIRARDFKGESGFLDRMMMIRLSDCRAHDFLASYQQKWRERSAAYWKLQQRQKLNDQETRDTARPTALTQKGYEFVLNYVENAFGSWIEEALGRVRQRFSWDGGAEESKEAIRRELRRRLVEDVGQKSDGGEA